MWPADSDDIKNVDLTKIHNLSGPIAVEGAEPGDCLVVDILDGTHAHGPSRSSSLTGLDAQSRRSSRCHGGTPYARLVLAAADAKALTPHLHTGHLRARERRRPLRCVAPLLPA